jgi:hypothetical protein
MDRRLSFLTRPADHGASFSTVPVRFSIAGSGALLSRKNAASTAAELVFTERFVLRCDNHVFIGLHPAWITPM